MKLKVIKTEAEYGAARRRLSELMDAEAGTPEADQLEMLAVLVEDYERKIAPIDPPDPIEAIRFRMEQAGLNQQDLVKYFGSRSRVSEILNRRRPLNIRIARALHEGLGIPADVLLRNPPKRVSEEELVDLRQYPVKIMAKRGWFPGFSGTPQEAVVRIDELLPPFLTSFPDVEDHITLNRQHIRSGSQMSRHALRAWRIRVLQMAKEQDLAPYRPGVINKAFMSKLVALSMLEDGPRLAKEFLARHGIALVLLKHLPKTYLDGAAMMAPWGAPVIALTLRYDRLDNFWYTLCHELAHAARHLHQTDISVFIDDLNEQGHGREAEADDYAMAALIPADRWSEFWQHGDFNPVTVRDFARRLNIHPSIVAGRVRRELNDYRILSPLVGAKQVRQHFDNLEGDVNQEAA